MVSISTKNYESIIRECFSSDKELIEKFHVEAPSSLDACVKRTVRDLNECNDFKFYCLINDHQVAGFFGVENKAMLTSFFLKPQFRNLKDDFWAEVSKKLGNDFYAAVYQKNERAKKFLDKYGYANDENNELILYKIFCQ